MALAELTNKITAEAREEAEQIIAQAHKEAEAIAKETDEKISELKKRYAQDLTYSIEENKSRVTASAEQEVASSLAQAKRASIDRVFTSALKKLSDISETEYKKIVKDLVGMIPRDTHAEAIVVPASREKETRQILKEASIKGDAKTSKNITGGFNIITKEIEYNFSFERIVQDKRAELETEVAHILFG